MRTIEVEPRRRRALLRLGLLACAGCAWLRLPQLASAASAGEAVPLPVAASVPASVPAPQRADPPRVRIAAVRGMSWRGNEAQVDLLLEVSNPRGWSLTLNDIRLRCSFNGVATATGNSTAGLVLPAHGQADVPVRVNIDGPALLAVLAALPPDGTVRYELDGDAEIGDTMLRVPFQQQGHVVLR